MKDHVDLIGSKAVKALIDRLRDELLVNYGSTVYSLIVSLWSADGNVEFRLHYVLQADLTPRLLIIEVPASVAANDAKADTVVLAVFKELQDHIDAEIAGRGPTNH